MNPGRSLTLDSIKAVDRVLFDINIVSGGGSYGLGLQPAVNANNSAIFTANAGFYFTGIIQSLGTVYDLVEFTRMRAEFTPAYHVGSAWDAFARNETAITNDTAILIGNPLSGFGSYTAHSPTQQFAIDWSPSQKQKSMGQPFKIKAAGLNAAATSVYNLPYYLAFYFPPPVGAAPGTTTYIGTVTVQYEYLFTGRNA